MITSLIKTVFIWFLQHIPAEKKRFITITVLYCLLEKEDVNTQMLKKLNKSLRLANNDDSLTLPELVTKVVWDHQLDSINTNEITACDKIFDKLPPYLKYDTDDKVKADIAAMIKML